MFYYYFMLSPQTKKQNSIVDLIWTLSKQQQTDFYFKQRKKNPQDLSMSISNNQKKPLRRHKYFFSNWTLNSWILTASQKKEITEICHLLNFLLIFSTLAVSWRVSFLFPLMIKVNYNLEWSYRKICHLIWVIRQREVLNTQSSNSKARKTFHYASHAWSLPTGRQTLIAGNQIHRLQKQIKSPNCSRQYTENEIKPLGINFFGGIHRFCAILEFALAAVMGRNLQDPLQSTKTLWRCPRFRLDFSKISFLLKEW